MNAFRLTSSYTVLFKGKQTRGVFMARTSAHNINPTRCYGCSHFNPVIALWLNFLIWSNISILVVPCLNNSPITVSVSFYIVYFIAFLSLYYHMLLLVTYFAKVHPDSVTITHASICRSGSCSLLALLCTYICIVNDTA